MITVKGAKSTSEPTDPAAPYARKPEEKSGAVAKLAVLLAAVTLYLKMLFSGKSEAAGATAPEGDAPDEVDAPAVAVVPGGLAEGDPQAVSRGGSQQADRPEPTAFDFTAGGDTIAFGEQRPLVSPVFQPAGYVAQQANSNAAPDWVSPTFPGASAPRPNAVGRGAAIETPSGEGEKGSISPDPTPADPPPDDPDSEDAPGDEPVRDGASAPEEGDGATDEDQTPDPETNRAPRVAGPVHLNDISGCAVLAIGMAEFLRGADDPDGDRLSIEAPSASSGTLEKQDDDAWVFKPGDDVGPVTVSYRISDGDMSVDQTLHFAVLSEQSIAGTDQDDMLVGTMCADEVEAGAGDDLVDSRGGSDVVFGGTGDDHVVAGDGDDVVRGGADDDVLFGGAGDDDLFGGAGDDRLFGGAGDDRLIGGSGDDLVMGGGGDDHASGGAGNDRLVGGAGDDMLFGNAGGDVIKGEDGSDLIVAGPGDDRVSGGSGSDRLLGGAGTDHLRGGAGDDVLLGGAGDDTIRDGRGEDAVHAGRGDDRLVAAPDGADDEYRGGEGSDVLDYSAAEEALVIDGAAGTASGVEIGEDTISGFERIVAGAGDDTIRFGGSAVSVKGGEGCNTFEFVAPELERASAEVPSRTCHEIEDFKVGDRLKMSRWEIFEDGLDDPREALDRVYRDDAGQNQVPIRFRNEWTDAVSETVVEADLDGDEYFETAVILDGRHVLALVETA